TWLFTTILRSHLEYDTLPWRNAAISGWVLDPDRKKMSKSKGNVVTPLPLLERHGADSVRYWAASGRPGTDTAVDEGQMKVGRRLALKILNASKFVIGRLGEDHAPPPAAVKTALDRDMLRRLVGVVDRATAALAGFDYTRALETTEEFFWSFCDDYVELVKSRAYGEPAEPATASARAALALALSVQLRLFAPFLPFVTEEVWSWWQEGSVHRSAWPDPAAEVGPALGAGPGAGASTGEGTASSPVLDMVAEVLGAIRREKSDQKRSMRTPVARLSVTDRPARLALLDQALGDLLEAGGIPPDRLATREGEPAVEVTLAPPEGDGTAGRPGSA
ncbi:MAG: class I tRNA ligase family protein, partial [Acidimicrobiales bacterium]